MRLQRKALQVNRQLDRSGYSFDSENMLWSRSGFSSIQYSDGEETEQELYRIVLEATDLSSFSDELQSHCTDWVTTYHLSKQRANLLRPFEEQLSGSVLEVGAGCGAITRYLGEVAESVVAVEGSLRRAQILRQRTRDLETVSVVVDNFETFDIDQRFDVVIVVGVLEYADMFLQSDKPFIDFLRKLRKLVSDDGLLFLAIENKLGLKYFAGANEDHLDAPMIGIEGRYQEGGPRTFSRNELKSMMSEAGFSSTFFHSPVPDYKLPVGVITEQGILDEKFNSAALSGEASLSDPQLPLDSHFNTLLGWQEIGGSGLELDVSNSFLVEARPQKVRKSVSSGLLAEHYGSVRKMNFQRTKRFTRKGGEVCVASAPTFASPTSGNSEGILQSFPPENYLFGVGVRINVIRSLLESREPAKFLEEWVPEWLNVLATHAHSAGFDWPENIRSGVSVDGRLLDAIPRNAIRTPEGVVFFDQEWAHSEQLSIERLLFRSILDVHYSMPRVWQTRWDLKEILRILSDVTRFDISDSQKYFDDESRFQDLVAHEPLQHKASIDYGLKTERDLAVSERDLAVSERDLAVSERDLAVSERDALLERLRHVESTRSWRWTNFLRKTF